MPKKILIIEDDPDILDVLLLIFSTDRFEPIVSARSLPAGEIVRIAPDVVLLDHWLGNGVGGDLCKEIKGHPSISKTPVIILSAHIDLHLLAVESRADGFFAKPFDIYELYNYVESFAFDRPADKKAVTLP